MTISPKNDLVIWTGPVWSGNLRDVSWARQTTLLTLPCQGSDACAAQAYNLSTAGRLRALCKAHQLDLDSFGRVVLGSFSAGHGLADLLLQDPEGLERVRAFGAFDSYYTGAASAIKKGYLAFGKLAAEGERVMWTSSSSFPDRKNLSCEGSIQALLKALNVERELLPDLSPLKSPKYFAGRGSYMHAFFDTTYKHTEHGTVIAPFVMERVLSPGETVGQANMGRNVAYALGAIAAGGAVAWGLSRLLRR